MRVLRDACLLVLLVLSQNSVSAKDFNDHPIRPTFGRDVAVRVNRGGDVEITLQAIPSFGNQIRFRIQESPLHGSLSEIHTTSDHTASVIYHHDGSKTPLEDEFSFRAQAKGQAFSEPSECRITIVPPQASLVFDPPALDFGRVMLSAKKQMMVTIRNQGGVPALGRLLLPRGFSAPEGDAYHLAEGESQNVPLEFDPMEERKYDAQVVTQPSCEKSPLDLRGEGVVRFDLQKLSLTEWEVRNLGDQAIRISCAGGEGWILPKEISVSPHESGRLIFQQSDETNEAEGEKIPAATSNAVVHLSDGLTEREIEMPPLTRFTPVVVQAVSPVDLGKLSIGGTQRVRFTLINRSEYPKHLLWRAVSPSGGGSDESDVLDLKGGESREINFDWKPSLPGEATLTISVQEGHATRHDLVWKASVLHSDAMVAGSSPHESQDAVAGEAPSVAATQPPSPVPAKTIPIPPVVGAAYEVKKPWLGGAIITMKWDLGGKNLSQFQLEEQGLVLDGAFSFSKDDRGKPQFPKSKTVVTPIEMTSAIENGSQEILKLRGLSAGWHHLVLSQRSKEGTLEAESRFQIRIPQGPSWWSRVKTPLGIILISLLLLLLRDIRRGGRF